ncbi:MAG: ATP-binding cassette domain-containing protein [Flavobacteriaceae bacterium]|jgi:ABC-2 type transport system ATP-binding protein|nr:ATP-binding cassette domain-containing protein [Flavobacteriales bacterium]MDG1271063.1 ATP-binding cassette domain-containing protein [Flavobacteriaceae bacterium]
MQLHLENVSKSYGDQVILKNLTLRLKKGEIIGFLGPNGAGKTTLMKILTGYLTQWEGSVRFETHDLKKDPQSVQRQLGYLPENNPLYGDMYVKEYLLFVGGLYGLTAMPIEDIAAKVGLEQHLDKKITTLSKGYKQRVGLAAALLHDPQLLILDEPTTGLDPNQLGEIRQLILDLGKEKTIFLSTHILSEVEALCDRVVILHQGKIVLDESLQNLRAQEKQIVEVSFDYRVEPVALERIKNAVSVKNIFDFQYEIEFDTEEDRRPMVFDFAHDNGLKIVALQHKSKNLEQRFNELTST